MLHKEPVIRLLRISVPISVVILPRLLRLMIRSQPCSMGTQSMMRNAIFLKPMGYYHSFLLPRLVQIFDNVFISRNTEAVRSAYSLSSKCSVRTQDHRIPHVVISKQKERKITSNILDYRSEHKTIFCDG